ncbi:hypothetical protein [Longitalea luteola]|uniref:hypothetical protein n=1 Tax=Longitalea luteola TaxID=2812563 RepID=UPI001A967FB9|nr:hypothetical protein [Longitalea luteola]
MKKLLTFLLLIVTIAGAIIPCCMADECDNKTSASHQPHPTDNEEKGNCSPFFACGTCAHAVEIISRVSITLPEYAVRTTYYHFYVEKLSSYHPSLFQPPRVG